MVDALVRKTEFLCGSVQAPSSKSYTHRAIIAASLSEGRSLIKKPLVCDDTLATIDACKALGAEMQIKADSIEVSGKSKPNTPEDVIFCRDSGSTIRFLTPVCALAPGISVLTGGKSLRRRPMAPLLEALRQLGVRCYSARGDGRPPLIVFGGGIKGGRAEIRGDVSSQFVSGLLFASPKADSDVELVLKTPLKSKPYVDMTVEVLQECGVKIVFEPDRQAFIIESGQIYTPLDYEVEGDYSSAAFILAAAALIESEVEVTNLRRDSIQGDRRIIDILREMGVRLEVKEDRVKVKGGGCSLSGVRFSADDNPDLVPVLMVLGCVAEGETVIEGVKRLRWKESSRVEALTVELEKLGGEIRQMNDKVVVKGARRFKGADLNCHGDHRVMMALTVAALISEGESRIHGVECVSKSYPNFIQDLISLGGRIYIR
ncbi:3-phosphoshikimate 1-carboxyvinyltransferase [Candidatus Bathyarchaeota archaeon]|nr:MAG: 3-phosphoshikimate 1-carboxyvinyltransferase [Candidatus Bathyarchaeota archaeon]RLI23241.1 MAG: 3-phosphoshikimate 1-carboxyvinyltransferase [Candidatus Bathyarchaeota archaeon]